jgi:PAS domain S-box-containing protein
MGKILIADDDPQNLYLLDVLLKSNGFEVDRAENGAKALDLAHKDPPQIVITDILMPVMDGFSLCSNWMEDENLKKIPFVFYTATYTDQKDESFALSLGAAKFLVKPMDPGDLLAAIQEVIKTHRENSQGIPAQLHREKEYYKEYSEILIHKLEQKTMQLEQANRRLMALYQASCSLISNYSIKDLTRGVLHSIVETAGYQQANFFHFNESVNKLFLMDAVGFSEETLTTYKDRLVFDLGEEQGLVGLVAQNRQLINIGDTSGNPLWIELDQRIHSALLAPVYYGKYLLGVVALFNIEKNAFSEEDERNIAALANSLAISIINKRIDATLSENYAILHSIIESSDSLIFSIDKQYYYTSFNKAHAAMMKATYGKDVQVGINFLDCIPVGKDQEQVKENIDRALAGQSFIEEICTEGEEHLQLCFEVTYTPIKTEIKEIIGVAIYSRDITKRKQGIETLRESEERFRGAFEQAAIGMCMISIEGKFIRVNAALCQMLGYSEKELLDMDIFGITHPDDITISNNAINQALDARNKSIQIEKRYIHKQGQIIWVSISTSMVFNIAKEPLYLISQIQNITDRKVAEADLEEERSLLRTLINTIPDTIYFKDLQNRFIRINQALVNHFGATDSSQVLGKTDCDFFSPEHAQQAVEDEQKIIQSGKPMIGIEEQEIWPDGRKKWVTTTKMPLYNNVGEIIGTFGISHDITHRKLAEEKLRESKEQFKSFFDNAFDAILLTSPDGSIFASNPAACKIFGWSEAEMIAGGRELLVDTTDPRLKVSLKTRAETGKVQTELTFLRKDGTKFEGELTSSVYVDRDGHQRTVITIRDVTERKQAERMTQKRLMELEMINHISLTLRGKDTVEELLPLVIDEALASIHTDVGCIFLFDPEINKLKISVTRGWWDKLSYLYLNPDEGITGHVFKTRNHHISSDIHDDKLLLESVRDLIPLHWSGVFLPIHFNQTIIGVLTVCTPSPRIVTENELRLLIIFSQLAGNSIYRAHLHEQLQLSNKNLQEEIDQRAIAQNLLATEKELLSTTLMNIGEGVIVTDKEGFITLYNSSAERVTGYPLSEAIEKPLNVVFQLYNPNKQEMIADIISTLIELDGERTKKINYRIPALITHTGDLILISVNISMLKSSKGEIFGYVIVFQDITEKQKLESQTALSQKMEAIGQLAAGIAHEINTPIQYIGDNLKFLKKAFSRYIDILDVYQNVTSEHLLHTLSQDDLDQLEEVKRQKKITYYRGEIPKSIDEGLDGVERVRKIVLAMREFSHPSEKGKKLADINHGIETTIALSRNEWKYCAEMQTDLDPNLPMVNCQIDEINQVILNMIVNAAQAIQEKTSVGSGSKEIISISTRKSDDKVIIIIRDTGPGIPEEIQARIFDPFFTTKEVGKGTGQGLSMAHNIIVNKHHGYINVYSKVGEGTAFTIELPLDTPQQEA